MAPTITVDGDEIIDASIDGDAVEEITIDGDLAWAAAVGLDGLTVTRQDGSYTASSGEHVVSNGGTITLPSPVQDGIVMITEVQTTPQLSGSIDGITDPYISGDDSVVFVSEGSAWYSVDRNQISAIPDSVLTQDLVAWYRFEDGDARDYTATLDATFADTTAYDGTVNGATFQSSGGVTDFKNAGSSGAFDFDSNNNEFIDISSASQGVNYKDFPFSVTIWAKVDSFTGGDAAFIGGEDSGQRVWGISLVSSSEVKFQAYDGNGSSIMHSVNPTSYRHYALTIDSNGNCTGYVDGSSVGTFSTGSLANSSPDIYLGAADFGDSPQFLDGRLDDARIYNRDLTSTEVSDIYNATEP